MSEDKRSGEWASVKVGDEICWRGGAGRSHVISATVERITPTGMVVDDKGNRWTRNGVSGSGWHTRSARLMTDEDRGLALAQKRWHKLFAVAYSALPLVQGIKPGEVTDEMMEAAEKLVSLLGAAGAL